MGAEAKDLPRRIADLEGHDAYSLLGLPPDADADQVVEAYRRAMARAHPDRGGAPRRAQLVNCAYEVLTRHRDAYDALRRGPGDGFEPQPLRVVPQTEPVDPPQRAPVALLDRRQFRVLALGLLVIVIAGALLLARRDGGAAGRPGTAGTQVGTPSPQAPASSRGLASWHAAAAQANAGPVPTRPSGGPSPSADRHGCQVRADSSLWCSGDNHYGQLGNGGPLGSAVPIRIGTAADRWAVVADGPRNSCAVRVDGALWCWGDNSHGQLADGSTSARVGLVPVSPGTAWTAIAVAEHVCGVRVDHTLWCWGAGGHGELGEGISGDLLVPRQVSTETSWAAVAVRAGQTCAVRRNGSQQCWGAA